MFWCSVEELGQRLSAHEFGHWWALYLQEPWGEARADLAAGQVAATVANVHRGKDAPAFKALDFAPYLQSRNREPAAPASPRAFLKTLKKGPHG